MSASRSRSRARGLLAAAVILLSAALLFLCLKRGGAPRPASEDTLLARPSPAPRPAQRAAMPGSAAPPEPSAEPAAEGQTLWQKRLSRAQRTLDSYLETTRYPFTSRPITEHPDQIKPHFVPDQKVRLKRRDDRITDARATLHQDRYYLVGDERAAFTITCENNEGPAPCEVLSTLARAEGSAGQGSVPFTAAQDGSLAAAFQPSAQGFASVHGPIRVFVDLRVDGEEGQVSFEVMFTPRAPAVFTGAIRESLSDGSLDLYVGLTVDKAGRYVIAARASDAEGHDFAYLSFNDELPAGKQEARLRLFGRLIRDQKAHAPFHLRDVEGFLLKEDAYPDRELMAALLGDAHTTLRYADRDFSDKEWQSEEKDRNVKLLTADVDEAKGHVAGGE